MPQRTPLSPALWRGHVLCRVLLALLTAGFFAAWVSEPAAAQGNVTPSSPCLDSRNLTELPSGALRNITNQPVLSSNGAQVAFWSTNNLVANKNNDGNIEIFVQNTNTGAVVQLTDSVGSILGGFNLDPSINTAGDRIAFFSDRDLVGSNADGNFEIFLARFASGAWTIRQVTNTSGSANLFPSINGDGTRIAFVSDDPGLDTVDPDRRNPDRNFEILLATVSATGATQQIRQLTTTPAGITNDQPSINASGARIAYSAGSGQSVQVFVWDAATGASTQLTTSGNSEQAAINGDGTRITYIATNASGGQSRVVLHRLSVDGTESSSQVIVPPASNTTYRSPSISSSGERVVFVAEQGVGTNRTVNVYLYDINSGLAVPISTLGGGAGEQPTISADGTRVTFVGTRSVGGSTASSGSDIYINECPQADLQLSLDNPPPATILAGVNLNYTLRVRNAGPSRADNVAIRSDLASLPALPANVSRILPNNCSVQVNQLVCNLGSLAVGGQASVTLGFNVPGNAGLADIVSRYTVVADVVDPRPADNDTGVLTTRVMEEAALALAVSPSANLILAGSSEILTYTLTIQNAGPSQARGAVLTDTLPSEVTLVNALLVSGGGAGAQCPQTANDTLVVCRLGDLGVGSTTVVRISIRAKASAPATLTNVAQVRSVTDELDKTNNMVTTSTPVDRAADLRISKAGPATVVAGTELTYTLFVTSTGPADATGVTVTDLLPANVRFVRNATAAGGSCAGANANQSAVCTVTGTLTPNTSRRFDFVAQVLSTAPAGVIFNKATVVSQRRDPDESNNTSNEVQTTVTLLADLGVFKTLQSPTDIDNVNVFDVIVFAIQVRNDGPSQAYSVVVTDVLPSPQYLTFNITNTQTTAGFYNSATGVWTLNQPLPVGRTETLLLAARVEQDAGGQTVTNTASVSGGQPEPQPNNNQNSFSVTVRPNLADLSVVKTAVPVTATAGQPLTYTITVNNSGPTRARDVVVTDTLPAGVNYVSANPDPLQPNDQCVRSGSTVTCTRRDPPLPNTPDTGTLDANTTLTYRIVVTHTVAEVITNTVRVGSSTPDITPTNNIYVLPVTINPAPPAKLTIVTPLPSSVRAGDPFTPGPIEVWIFDRFDNLVKVGPGATDTIQIAAYSDAACANSTGTVVNSGDQAAVGGIATYTNSISYTVASPLGIFVKAVDPAFSDAVSACIGPIIVTPGAAYELIFDELNSSQTITAGNVSELYTVFRQDRFGNLVTTDPLTLNLASTSPTATPFLASDGVTYLALNQLTIPNLAAEASFRYTDTVQGVYTITVSDVGSPIDLIDAQQAVTVTADVATHIVFKLPVPTTATAGFTVGPFTLERRDRFDNPNFMDAPLTIALTTTSPGAVSGELPLFLNSAQPITSVQIVTATAGFLYKDFKAGTHTITADGGAFTATTSIEVTPGAAYHLTFLTDQRVITAGTTSDLITIQVQDVFGNAVTPTVDSPLVVGLSSTNVGGPYDFRDVDFTPNITQRVIGGTSTASFRYYDETAGTWSIGVNAALPQADSSQSLTVNPDNATQLAFVTPPHTVVAGEVSPVITVQRQDDFGNPNTANATVTLNVATDAIGAHDIFTQTDGPPISYLTGPSPTIEIGSHSASFFYTDTVRGTKTITASDAATVTPILTSDSQTITVKGGQATRLVLSSPSATTTAGVPINLTVSALDSLGNLADYEGVRDLTFGGAGVAATGQPPTVSDSGGQPQAFGAPTSLFFSGGAATVSGAANGVLTLYKAEAATLTATDPAANITTVPDGNLTVAVSPNDATHVEARTLPVGGVVVATQAVSAGTTIPIYAVGLDLYRNETGTVDANWEIATTDEVAQADITPTDAVSMTTFTARKVGTAVITPVFDPLLRIPTGVITVTAGNAVKVRVETTGERFGTVVPPQTISAGTNITVYAVTRDAFDNFVGNPVATWDVITRTGGVIAGDLTTASGASTVFRGRAAGSGYIQATFGGLPWIPSGQITVTPGNAAYLKLTAPSTTFTAGVTQTLSITAFDSFANVVVGYSGQKTLTFSGAQPSTRLVFTPTVVNNSGAAVHFGQPTDLTFVNGVLDTTGGAGRMTLYRRESNIPINATDGLIGSSPTGTLTVTVNTGARERLDISGPSVVTAGVGVQLTIRVVDLYGNVDTSFTGQPAANVNLVFTGANQAPNGVDNPTVTRDDGNQALNFNQNTRMDFVNGETVFGTNGGIMTLVKVETTTIHVTGAAGVDSLPYGGLPVTVLPGLTQNIGLSLTSPQVVSQTFTGAGSLLIRDQYQNPVTNYNAATRPITLTGNGTFAAGTIKLAGSGDDNVLNEADDVVNGSAVLTATGLGMVYIGPSGTGTFTAAAAPPQAGQATIAAGTSGNVTMNPGTPVSAAIQGRLGAGAYASALSVTAGTPISLQVSLRDIAGNLTPLGLSSFSIAFAGAPTSGGVTPPDPTVVDRTNVPVAFGQTTTLDFSDGQSTVTGAGANGVLRLYQSGVYTITMAGPGVVTSPGGGLVVTVTPGPLAQLDLQLTSPQTVGQEFVEINTLTVRDTYNNVLVDWQNGTRNVTFTVTSPIGATITFAGSANDNQLEPGDFSDGVANLSEVFFERMIYNGLPGEATIQAQSGAVIGIANVTINAAPP